MKEEKNEAARKGKGRKALIGVGLAAGNLATGGLLGVAALTSSKALVETTLRREEPRVVAKVRRGRAERPDEDPYLAAATAGSEALLAQPCEEVRILSGDGTRLVGHWLPAQEPKRLVICMHGWRSPWHVDFGQRSELLSRTGCSVLYAEQRGQDASGGEYMGFGLTERYDALAWAQWAEALPGDLPIYLFGVSMGATTVMMSAGSDLPARVRGVIADCGFTSPGAIWRYITEKKIHLPYDLGGGIVEDMVRRRIDVGPDDYSTTEALRQTTIPVLFIHGTDDAFVPIEMTYENYKACAAPKRLLVVPGAGHCMSYFTDPAGYEAAVTAFWRDFDRPEG